MSSLKNLLPYLREKISEITKKVDKDNNGIISIEEGTNFILENPDAVVLIVFVVIGWLWNPLVTIYESINTGTFQITMLTDLLLDVGLPALLTLLFRYYSRKYLSNENALMKSIQAKDKLVKARDETITEWKHKYDLDLLKAQDECRIMQTALKTKDLEIQILNEKLEKK